MVWNMAAQLPKKVEMLELLLRDGMQHLPNVVPTDAKVWFADQFVRAGYKRIEVTNFGHPRFLPQSRDAEDVLKRVSELPSVKQNKPHLKCYGMTKRAFERAAECAQKGFPPHSLAFTISTEDLHCRRNSSRTREEYLKEIPEFVKIAKANNFEINMALACVYGSPIAGPVPVDNTIELIQRGLDMGIRKFTPCDTTGESNPLRAYEYMSALVDKFGKYDNEAEFRIAHFHEGHGMSIANTFAAILAGARVIETSLGLGGGQPSFIVDGVPGVGSGPYYDNSMEKGNCSTEDCLVTLDECGIDTGINIDKVLQLGRVYEWVLGRTLLPWSTKSGRPIKQPVEWNISESSLDHVPPYGPPQIFWADPGKYKPASAAYIAKQFEGRELRWDPWEEQVKKVKEK